MLSISRDPREGWPLLTVETEANGDSWSAYAWDPSLVGSKDTYLRNRQPGMTTCPACSLQLETVHTDKKENQIFLIYKEIQNRAVAKSYMTKGLLICG
jgi:hypothetical protein